MQRGDRMNSVVWLGQSIKDTSALWWEDMRQQLTLATGGERVAVDEHVWWVVLIQRVVDSISVRLDKLRRLTGEHLTTQHGQLFQVPTCSSQ